MTSPLGSFSLLRPLSAPKRRLGARLGMSFGLMCLPLLFVGGLAIMQSRTLQGRFVGALEGSVPALMRLQTLDHEVQMVNMAARDALLAPDDDAAAAASRAAARRDARRNRNCRGPTVPGLSVQSDAP